MINFKNFKTDFMKNVLVVMSGTAIAQGIGLLLMPVISRLYTPTDFGVLGSFLSVVSILGVCATFQYSQALMLPKKISEAANLLAVAITSTFAVAIVSGMVCVFYADELSQIIKYPLDPAIILLIPIAVFVIGFNNSMQSWCVRQKFFKRTSFSQIIRTSSVMGGQISCGFIGLGSLGLVAGTVFGDLMSSVNLSRAFSVRTLPKHLLLLNLQDMFRLAKLHKDFAIYSNSQSVMNAIAFGMPVIFLARYYDVTTAGLYAFSARVLQAPADLVIRALRQVLFQKYCEVKNAEGDLRQLFKRSTVNLAFIAIIPVGMCILWAPQIFAWVFGQEWIVAGKFSQWIILGQFAMFCNVPAVLLGQVVGQQKKFFIYYLFHLIASFLILIVGGGNFQAITTVAGLSLVNVVTSSMLIIHIWYWLKRIPEFNSLVQPVD